MPLDGRAADRRCLRARLLDDRRPGRRVLHHVDGTAADDCSSACAGAQLRQSHSYRHRAPVPGQQRLVTPTSRNTPPLLRLCGSDANDWFKFKRVNHDCALQRLFGAPPEQLRPNSRQSRSTGKCSSSQFFDSAARIVRAARIAAAPIRGCAASPHLLWKRCPRRLLNRHSPREKSGAVFMRILSDLWRHAHKSIGALGQAPNPQGDNRGTARGEVTAVGLPAGAGEWRGVWRRL